jgi:hypothetical protein
MLAVTVEQGTGPTLNPRHNLIGKLVQLPEKTVGASIAAAQIINMIRHH